MKMRHLINKDASNLYAINRVSRSPTTRVFEKSMNYGIVQRDKWTTVKPFPSLVSLGKFLLATSLDYLDTHWWSLSYCLALIDTRWETHKWPAFVKTQNSNNVESIHKWQIWLRHFIISEAQCGHEHLVITKTVAIWTQSQAARLYNLRHVLRHRNRTESDFTRTFPPWKSDTKASGVPVCWLSIAGHLEETFHRQNVADSQPLLLFMKRTYCL